MSRRGGTLCGGLVAALAVAVGICGELPTDSIYQMQARLTTQSGATAGLDLDRGHPTVISMFYGSCPAACPMLITAIQVYEAQLPESPRAQLRVLMVSFDAARDTPAQLEHVAKLHRADPGRWTFANASESDARRIAALLGISYRRLPDGDYDHSLLITLLDAQGRIVARTTTLVGDQEFAAKLRAATEPPPH